MNWTIKLSNKAKKDLKAIRDETLNERIKSALYALEDDPYAGDVKKLSGWKDRWRLRVGDWRVVYSLDNGILLILVLTVAKRGDVYLKLGR